MNRRILLQVTAPALLLGLLLLSACLAGAWYSDRLQRNLDRIRTESVISLQTAQELEISFRQLRFHSFAYLMEPTSEYETAIQSDHGKFENALYQATRAAHEPEELTLLKQTAEGYQQYRQEMDRLAAEVRRTGIPMEFHSLALAHPIKLLLQPCQDLLTRSQERMEQTFQESDSVNGQARLAMLLLGIGGPIGGILCGFGIARGLSRSIYQLSVRVQDVAQRLDQNLTSVTVAADGDLSHLDKQLQQVVQRVEEVAERAQRHQREMLRAEQLSAVGQLAASVAHEVRNPLTSVKLLVEAALRPRNHKPLSPDDLRVIHGEVVRLEHTVQGFLDFARLPTPRRSVVNLRGAVDHALELVSSRARQQCVKIETACPDKPVLANVDTGQFHTVLINLFLNALDMMPQGGVMEIRMNPVQPGQVRLTVSDTGAGIAPEMAGRIFTPFASSKPTGTGLGLSISRRIIEEHGGTITAANRPSGGACFTIMLPVTAAGDVTTETGALHANLASHR